MAFLKYMMDWDADKSHFDDGGTYAINFATVVGGFLDTNKTAIYNAYREWKEWERVDESDDGPRRPGAFRHPTTGNHTRGFLLEIDGEQPS